MPSEERLTWAAAWARLRAGALEAAEGAMAEVPATLRRLRVALLVTAVTVPVFLVGLLVVLWHVAS
ncbi:MAG: hypothetical protein M3Q23_04575 [Actinomycetota bacterium]|nr:hypothetical protein [Actinomycetota bacterium]